MRKKILTRRLFPIIVAVVLAAVIAAPVLASPATATRTLPSSVESGAEFDVSIQASGCGAFGQVVETLPDGFTYISCTPGDVGVEQVGNTIKSTFLGSASFTYKLEAPTVDTTSTYTFHGVVKDENKNEYPIQDSLITVTVGVTPPETYTLTMAVNGNGSITPPVGSHTYDAGSVVDISATADSGWRFDHWSGNVADPSSSSTTVTMDSDKTVTAYFVQVSGTRTLPSSVASGADFDVTIAVSGCGIWGQVIETLPSGFTYVSCSLPADQIEQIGNMLKFTFLGDSASFTYRVKAPTVDVTTTYTFQGKVLDEDRISYPIEEDEISVIAFNTALTNVGLVGADSTVTGISICSYPTEDLTNVPPDLDPQSAYTVDSTGTGTFTLRFTDIANASNTVVYKVTDSSWTELEEVTTSENTVELSLEVGDPVIVFATPAALPAIGGDAYFPSMLGLLIPWIALGVILMGSITWFVLRRRKA